jgi:ketosteroid isomerase-like protein
MDAEEVVRKVYEGFSTRDLPGTMAVLSDDLHWSEAAGLPWGGEKQGAGTVAEEVFGASIGLLPDLAVEIESLVASGDTVAVIHRYKSASKGLDLPGSGWWTVADGKVVRYRQFVDTVVFRESLPEDA